MATIDESTLLSAMEGVPQAKLSKVSLESGINIIDFISEKTAMLPSKTEARKMIQGNGISINREKVSGVDMMIDSSNLINGKYILAQRGKKEYCLVIVE